MIISKNEYETPYPTGIARCIKTRGRTRFTEGKDYRWEKVLGRFVFWDDLQNGHEFDEWRIPYYFTAVETPEGVEFPVMHWSHPEWDCEG